MAVPTDDELQIMTTVVYAFRSLDTQAQARVIDYLISRFLEPGKPEEDDF